MKKVLIIGRQKVGEKNDAFLMAQAIAAQSTELEVAAVYFEDIVVSASPTAATAHFITKGGERHDVADDDALILINWSHDRLYMDLAHSIALIASRAGVAVWNKELITARSSTKVSQLVTLSGQDVRFPKSLFSLTKPLLEAYSEQVGLPFIAKDPLASRGRNNYLSQNWDAFTQQVKDSPASYVLQEYIPNDKSDLRLFVTGGKAEVAILRKGSDGTHLNNISQGGQAELVPIDELPGDLIADAERIAGLFERELCGIDFMRDQVTGTYSFLEINTTPQIINGAFVEAKAVALARSLERIEA